MRTVKATVLGSILVGITALSSQAWADTLADTLVAPPSTLRAMNQEPVQSQQRMAPTAADFERLNERNRNESKMMNRPSQGTGTGSQHRHENQYRYGSGSMS